ncbi:MAG: flavodoxin family protein [Eggerthellaceae bacterium]|jgi:multimeric flavodoxin WrbA
MNAVILMASPKRNGRCARWARELAAAYRSRGAEASVLAICDLDIAGCRNCDGCRHAPEFRCVIEDDMAIVDDALKAADELAIVSPVFFAGPPAQLKAVLDRLQPHFWRETRMRPKRPAALYVVGDGGDPYGYEPLVAIVRSALAVGGFKVRSVETRIGSTE